MNKSESKYFNTAERIDEAFLELLNQKEFEYITVKEICAKAGINRSTFYLHYETIDDLVQESAEYMVRHFISYYEERTENFVEKIQSAEKEELFLITPEYLTPYLQAIKENRKIFQVAIQKSKVIGSERSFSALCKHVLNPILDRFQVPETDRKYILTYYIGGIMAVLQQWMKEDCQDPIETIISFLINYITPVH